MAIDRDTTNWTFETDVAVVGSGGCGLTAAIAAAQGGAEAIVFEKQERPWSNTARSGGMIPAAGTRFQKAAGIEERFEDLAEDIFRKNHRSSDREERQDGESLDDPSVESHVSALRPAALCRSSRSRSRPSSSRRR